MKLSKALDYFLAVREARLSPSTKRYYQTAINRLIGVIGDIGLRKVKTKDLHAFVLDLTNQKERWRNNPYRPSAPGGLSKFTIARMIQAVKSFFAWFVREEPERLSSSPAAKLEYKNPGDGPLKYITQQQIDALLGVATHPRDYALVRFALATGARRGGLQGMTVEHLDFEEQLAQVTEKGDKTRSIYFDDDARDALLRWLRVRPQTTRALWAKDDGEALTLAGLRQVMVRLCRRANLPLISLHQLRHTFAHTAMVRGVPIHHIQTQMGHADEETTLRYARQVDSDRKRYFGKSSMYETTDRRPSKEQFRLVKSPKLSSG